MKAIITSETVYEGVMDFVHDGGGQTCRRLVVKDAGNLSITPHEGAVYVARGFSSQSRRDFKVLGEVEVPDELVEKALAVAKAVEELNRLAKRFEALLGTK